MMFHMISDDRRYSDTGFIPSEVSPVFDLFFSVSKFRGFIDLTVQ